MRPRSAIACVLSFLMLAACQPRQGAAPSGRQSTPASQAGGPPVHPMPLPVTVADWASGATLLDGLGDFHRRVTTGSNDAQRYFDQGMRLLWAFNHDESARSFAKAAQIDPQCASCYWGVALTVGPNYNLPMMAEPRARVASEALALARKNAARATPVEQALIAALASRYPDARPLDASTQGPVLTAYADAMRRLATRFPDDLDVQTLFAESVMNINAWKLWTPDGKPAPGTREIQATLERVMSRDPRHPGANHYYVHTMEASPHPESALAAAGRLPGLMPAAGHLEHMPAHVLQRVGRYEEASEANRKGAAADEIYFTRVAALDYYPMMYTAHNYQFLACSAAMQGRRAETLDAVRNSRRVTADDILLAMPGFDWPLAEEYAALVRFGLWDQMLERRAPNPQFAATTGGYLYARGVALAAKGRLDEASQVAGALTALIARLPADSAAGNNKARDVLGIGLSLVQARIAAARHRPDDAIALLGDAADREDRLAYNEPKDWFFPVRHLLGAQLLEVGKPAAAEVVFREDLRRNPANGWALFGLATALERQHKAAEAARVQRQFQEAWKLSDITLSSSAF